MEVVEIVMWQSEEAEERNLMVGKGLAGVVMQVHVLVDAELLAALFVAETLERELHG